ncbi:hypothetical protein BRE01_23140 [Brevibacillus reuszeri]|uniref:Mas-related G-protein coupled receptor member D n=1 Tax=Brevibacillus reuszeri TaxID=54915 RepID=A0ABQ0TLA9_9BACL|nr:hypothetical protein [Brevibacillus reuszeri]MED1858388.1 hypothetical protein [Brevibacillus reuszeri]GED68612.1 hypothetical protein BRE01_23140 [Brevibacillus reuszeri]
MENALIAFGATIIVGIVSYIGTWLSSFEISRTFTKWYFLVILAAALILGVISYFFWID